MTDSPDEITSTTPSDPAPAGATGVTDTASSDGTTDQGPRVQRPTLSRDVWYSDKQVPESVRAAKVTGTRTSIAENEGVPLPEDDMHVHLIVFPPQGTAYPVRDVPYDANGAGGTWRWPTRADA